MTPCRSVFCHRREAKPRSSEIEAYRIGNSGFLVGAERETRNDPLSLLLIVARLSSPFYRRGSQEKTLPQRDRPGVSLASSPTLLIWWCSGSPLPRTIHGHAGKSAISVFLPKRFSSFLRDEAQSALKLTSRTRLSVATMVLLGTRGPLLCRVIRGSLQSR